MDSFFQTLFILTALAIVVLIVLGVTTTGEWLRSHKGVPRPERRRAPLPIRGVLWVGCAALGLLFLDLWFGLRSVENTPSVGWEALANGILGGMIVIALMVIGAVFTIVFAIAALVSRGLRRRDPTG